MDCAEGHLATQFQLEPEARVQTFPSLSRAAHRCTSCASCTGDSEGTGIGIFTNRLSFLVVESWAFIMFIRAIKPTLVAALCLPHNRCVLVCLRRTPKSSAAALEGQIQFVFTLRIGVAPARTAPRRRRAPRRSAKATSAKTAANACASGGGDRGAKAAQTASAGRLGSPRPASPSRRSGAPPGRAAPATWRAVGHVCSAADEFSCPSNTRQIPK